MSYDDGGRPGSWPPHDPTANPEPPPSAAPVPYGQPGSPPPPPEGAPPPPPPPDAPAQWVPPPPGGPALPMPVVQVSPPQWRPLSGLASALTVLFTLDALAGLFAVGSIANRLNVINDFENGNFGLDIAKRAQDADDLAKAAAAIYGLLGLATAVVFIIWMWRAAKNNEALGRMNPRFGPGWSIGGWFIPIANFVIPILIMQDLWRGSDPGVSRGDPGWRTSRGSGLFGWWWAVWLLGVVRVFVGSDNADSNHSIDDIKRSNQVALFSLVAYVAAAVLAISVVRKLTARQEACLRAQQAAWHAANPGVV